MEKHNINPKKSLIAPEFTKFKDQFNQTFEGFFKQPQSMKMLSIKIKIDRSNICWFCRELRKNNQIGVLRKAICEITKRRVNYYTTNPELIPKSNQLDIFNQTGGQKS